MLGRQCHLLFELPQHLARLGRHHVGDRLDSRTQRRIQPFEQRHGPDQIHRRPHRELNRVP
jgi:hypothetical protein